MQQNTCLMKLHVKTYLLETVEVTEPYNKLEVPSKIFSPKVYNKM